MRRGRLGNLDDASLDQVAHLRSQRAGGALEMGRLGDSVERLPDWNMEMETTPEASGSTLRATIYWSAVTMAGGGKDDIDAFVRAGGVGALAVTSM